MNDIFQPIRMYSDSAYTFAARQALNGYKYIPTVYADSTSLIPFQLLRLKSGEQSLELYNRQVEVTTLQLISTTGGSTINLLSSPYAVNHTYYVMYPYDEVNEGYWDAMVYRGDSTIQAIPQGKYYLYAEDDDGNKWTGSYIIIANLSRYITFQYRYIETEKYSLINNYMVFDNSSGDGGNGFYWKMIFKEYAFDSGEVEETTEELLREYGEPQIGFRRLEKLHTCQFLADSNTYDALLFMSKYCNDILITDETGRQRAAEIKDITPESIKHSNHMEVTIKFVYTDDKLLSTNVHDAFNYANKVGENNIAEVTDLLMSKDQKVKTHGKFIRKR
jgi:hypothetical protein